jgi:23S rRNA (adenine2503-C2)-methyltransferase
VNALLAHTPDELRELFRADGLEPWRADQVARWVFERRVCEFEAMTDLSRALRAELAARWSIRALSLASLHRSEDGTAKLALSTADGAEIEAVLIPEKQRRTLCVSSQVGCSLDCSFCATGRLGLGRNLRAEEIVAQALAASELLAESGERLSHVVFMGMGEPLLNLRAVTQAIRVLSHPRAFGISPRRITVSTAGVVPRLEALASALPVRLAISLHATTDAVRDRLVPLNRRFPLAQLLEACARLPGSKRDRLTFEYALIEGVNDSDDDAERLARMLRGREAKVNVIPLNPVPGIDYRRPSDARVDRFAELVSRGGVLATVRRSRGDDIYAACGQLGRLSAPEPSAAREGSAEAVRYASEACSTRSATFTGCATSSSR